MNKSEWDDRLNKLIGWTPSNKKDNDDLINGLKEIICMIDQLKSAGWTHEQAVDFVCRLLTTMNGGPAHGSF